MDGPIYNATFLRGLAVTRLRLDDLGRIVEAEGFDEHLRRWTHRATYESSTRFSTAIWTRESES